MSCNNNLQTIAHKTSKTFSSPNEPATFWEHIVLHKTSQKEIMLFDLEIEDKEANTSNNNPNCKMSALDAATNIMMEERQRCVSAPENISTTMATDTAIAAAAHCVPTQPRPTSETETETEMKFRAAILADLERSSRLESQTSPSDSDPNSLPPPSHHMIFGPIQLLALSPETQHDEAKRQEALVKTRSTASLTLTTKRRLSFRDDRSGAIVRDEELVMSGALDWADVRCEVCAARERAMGGLEEAGIVAL
jgi:hypothetical protein